MNVINYVEQKKPDDDPLVSFIKVQKEAKGIYGVRNQGMVIFIE